MKSLWHFLAQNHKGMINGTRWWAVFVEGTGNEEQPTDTHPEISKCTILRRNELSVFHLSPCQRLNISFESCCQKALRQWIHQREAKRHLQLLVTKSYPKATKPISLSKILHPPHKPHPPPQYSQYIHNILKSWQVGKTKQGCCCTWQSSGRWDRNPKGRCRGRALLCRALRCAAAIPAWFQSHQSMSLLQSRQQGLAEGWSSNLLPCQPAGCTFQLIKPKDWGEFHQLNPQNIEKGGRGENSNGWRTFSSERCFFLLE